MQTTGPPLKGSLDQHILTAPSLCEHHYHENGFLTSAVALNVCAN